mmetsp:Transcript_23486/g.44258  ORF Transcript_23486/g.44258 Transcript_23486/m.44258 type:complete len:103 (+) Transcript_23486:68-376(+)
MPGPGAMEAARVVPQSWGPPRTTVVQVAAAFVGEQMVFGETYQGGLPPPEWWWGWIAQPSLVWPPPPPPKYQPDWGYGAPAWGPPVAPGPHYPVAPYAGPPY